MDRLTIFDDCALVGQSHRRAVDLIVESADTVAASGGGPRLEIVVGEAGGGRTRVLREVFERLCERLDPDGAYADTLASQSLQADRLDSAAPAPFWWWHLDFGREESLFRLVGADLEQLKVARSERAALISFLNGLTTVSGLLGATLPLNLSTIFDIRDGEEVLQETFGAHEQNFDHSITATVGHFAASIALLSRHQLFVLVIDDVERADEKATRPNWPRRPQHWRGKAPWPASHGGTHRRALIRWSRCVVATSKRLLDQPAARNRAPS